MKAKNKEGYKIPENYFASSKKKTLEMIESQDQSHDSFESKSQTTRSRRLYPILGIAASLLLIVGLFISNEESSEPTFANLDEATLIDYIDDNIDAYSLGELSELSDPVLDDLDFIDDSEYLDFLEEIDVDDLYDLM